MSELPSPNDVRAQSPPTPPPEDLEVSLGILIPELLIPPPPACSTFTPSSLTAAPTEREVDHMLTPMTDAADVDVPSPNAPVVRVGPGHPGSRRPQVSVPLDPDQLIFSAHSLLASVPTPAPDPSTPPTATPLHPMLAAMLAADDDCVRPDTPLPNGLARVSAHSLPSSNPPNSETLSIRYQRLLFEQDDLDRT